jgi:CBS domain-containing protein
MARWMYVSAEIAVDAAQAAEVFRSEGVELLRRAVGAPAASGADQRRDGSFRAAIDATGAGATPMTGVDIITGAVEQRNDRLRLAVRWRCDQADHLLPAFDGRLEVEVLGPQHACVTLLGRGNGPAGDARDAAGRPLYGVADRVLQRLVDAVAGELGRRVAGPSPPQGAVVPTELHVRDVMSDNPLILDEDLPLRTAALLLFHERMAGAPVVSDDGELLGVLSEADLLPRGSTPRWVIGRAAREEYRRRTARTVGRACTRPAVVTTPEVPLHDAVRALLDHDVARLVVVQGGEVVGMLTRHDVLRALTRADAELQAVIERELDLHDAREVHASVEWGVVTLTGRASTRSLADRLPRRIAGIDGILSVVGTLSWVEDDTTPLPGSPTIRP